jgi:hypothetical protein
MKGVEKDFAVGLPTRLANDMPSAAVFIIALRWT